MDPFQDILDGFKIGASGQSCSHLRKSCRQPKIFLDQWSEYFRKTCSEIFWLVMNDVLCPVIKISTCSLSMVLLISDNFAGNTCNISYFVYLWSLWILCISSNHMWIFHFLKWFTSYDVKVSIVYSTSSPHNIAKDFSKITYIMSPWRKLGSQNIYSTKYNSTFVV